MGKIYNLTLDSVTSIDMDVATFNRLLSSAEAKDDNSIGNKNILVMTLPKGKWCGIKPGIAFEITEYANDSANPGYIAPVGNGCCNIYSESGETKIKIERYYDEEHSYGKCHVLGKLVEYGPFNRKFTKDCNQTAICYFNNPGNYKNSSGESSLYQNDSLPPHVFMILNSVPFIIIDYRANAHDKIADKNHWKERYINQFDYNDNRGTFDFNKEFITKTEGVDISLSIPEGLKVSEFICHTTLSSGKLGSLLTLSNGHSFEIYYPNTDNDIMLFNIGKSVFTIIPENHNNKLQFCQLSSNVLMPEASIIGVRKSAVNYNQMHAVNHKPLPEIWEVPMHNNHFVGREAMLTSIKNELTDTETLTHAIVGPGGAGKTQLANEFVWQNYKNYQGVCWLKADDEKTLIKQYISLGRLLNLIYGQDSPETQARIVIDALQNDYSNWLLIFDNAPNYETIQHWMPVKNGKILITSDYNNWPEKSTFVNKFTQDEARILVEKITGLKPNQDTDELIQQMDFFPLALAQASACIKRLHKSVSEYLISFSESPFNYLNKNLLPPGEYHAPLAKTWLATLDKIKQECPEAVELLLFCSYIQNKTVPLSLVSQFLSNNKILINKAMMWANKYFMIEVDRTKDTLSLSSLLKEVLHHYAGEKKDYYSNIVKEITSTQQTHLQKTSSSQSLAESEKSDNTMAMKANPYQHNTIFNLSPKEKHAKKNSNNHLQKNKKSLG